MEEAPLLIGGRLEGASGGRTYDIPSPATGKVIGRAAAADAADVELAVSHAQRAFREWAGKTAYEREAIIRSATQHARTRAEEIGRLMALEQGKPWKQSTSESCDIMDYYAAEGPRIEGTIHPTEKSNYRSWVIHQPVGVCAAITPWNYPVALLSWKLGPALAAGCPVVVKPTPITPLCASAFCRALSEGGLPNGVVNVITGPDAELGEMLVTHPNVAKVAMTGSTKVGKRILETCAPALKRVSLELGGHCPAIVCADADLDLAAQVIAYKGFRNGGQSCSSVNRVFVHESVHDALAERLVAQAEAMTMGDGLANPAVDLGPLTTKDTLSHVESHVEDAVNLGAKVLCGGTRPSGSAYQNGYYFLPTVLTKASEAMRLWQEETFGPVVPLTTFEKIEDAVARANDSHYGLVSYVFASELRLSMHLSEALESGTVCVNHGAVNTAYGPYQGWKDSGFGLELSRHAIFEYLKIKHIKIAL